NGDRVMTIDREPPAESSERYGDQERQPRPARLAADASSSHARFQVLAMLCLALGHRQDALSRPGQDALVLCQLLRWRERTRVRTRDDLRGLRDKLGANTLVSRLGQVVLTAASAH